MRENWKIQKIQPYNYGRLRIYLKKCGYGHATAAMSALVIKRYAAGHRT